MRSLYASEKKICEDEIIKRKQKRKKRILKYLIKDIAEIIKQAS